MNTLELEEPLLSIFTAAYQLQGTPFKVDVRLDKTMKKGEFRRTGPFDFTIGIEDYQEVVKLAQLEEGRQISREWMMGRKG